MATGTRNDPYRNFRFLVQIDGLTHARFSDCSGFGSNADPIEYREGGDEITRKLPGPAKYSNITLKWGLTDSRELYDWYKNITKGIIERRSGSIITLDPEGNPTVQWDFFNAWPTKWDGPDFSAKGNDVAIETLELVCEKIERV